MKRTYRDYSDDDLIKAVKECYSAASVLKTLSLATAGGNYANLYRNIQRLNLDSSHWTKQGWNRDQRLKDWSDYSRGVHLKPHLIKERGHRCESCFNFEWLTKKITLEIHHIDGDRTNNKESNLLLLCPNCHSYTKTWRRSKPVENV